MRRLVLAVVMTAAVVLGSASFGGAAAAQGPAAVPEATDPPDGATDAGTGLAPVDVLQVTGLLDGVVVDAIDRAIQRAVDGGSQALILQIDSLGAVISTEEMHDLLARVDSAPVAIGIWVGPSGGARLYGLPAQLMAVADVTAMVSGSRIGYTGRLLEVDGEQLSFGAADDRLRDGSLSFQEARSLGALKLDTPDLGVPTIRSMVLAMDGVEVNGVVLDTVIETVNDDGGVDLTSTLVRFSKLTFLGQLMHTAASPPVAYLLLLIGLALLLFEFYTAGVGVAGVVGAGSAFLGIYGVAELPARGWAVALIVAAFLAFAIDVQVGIPRLWTGIGMVFLAIGSWFVFEPLPGASLRPGWITLAVGVGGCAIVFFTGMPSMVRTRFATPTIGREWMIGELGDAIGPVDPDGVVSIGGARWRARTNRATPIASGERVRVVSIDGITLEVEPESGGARDYRERRSSGD